MTREQREAIAKAVGSLWAVATVIAEDKAAEAVINTADDLDKILMEEVDAANWCDSCTVTYGDGSKVDET